MLLEKIFVKGARTHNLKNVDVVIPRNRLVVVSGVSGSGKSSLTMDTLYAEGQRRYVESLSAYARQFLTRMRKPEVDFIHGLVPAIAIEQKVLSRSGRSTVGTLTEILDFLRLLYARAATPYSPVSGREVKRYSVSDVVDWILALPEGTSLLILAPAGHLSELTSKQGIPILQNILQKGYRRLWAGQRIYDIEDILSSNEHHFDVQVVATAESFPYYVVIDRVLLDPTEDALPQRLADSVQQAFSEGHGRCAVYCPGSDLTHFSTRLEAEGITFEEPSPQFFNFNSPYGACAKCEGFGSVIGIDEDLVIPNKHLSVYEGAVVCWNGEKMSEWKDDFIRKARSTGFPIHKPVKDLSERWRHLLWHGDAATETYGINDFFRYVESQTYKIQYRVLLARYRGKTRCPACGGSRLRPEAAYYRVAGKTLPELLDMPIGQLAEFFEQVRFSGSTKQATARLLQEIRSRLHIMKEVGLSYLTLNRPAATLSGGESQRIQLTRLLGSNLTSSLYILDEPTVGLHPRDTHRLINVLKQLRDKGNTVVVVEHDPEVMQQSDYLIDLGPRAGRHGGEVVFSGPIDTLSLARHSLTAEYLNGQRQIEVPRHRRPFRYFIHLNGASANNLKNIDVTFPLQALTVVTGVSGSGKSSLVTHTLYPALRYHFQQYDQRPGPYRSLTGDLHRIAGVELVDQHPIGKSSRSNPVTYVGAFDALRELFARQPLARLKGFQPRHFSFNVEGGRCEACKGEGEVVVEMQFLADVHLPCEVCGGKRFQEEVLEITYKGKNIADVLALTVDEAIDFFSEEERLVHLLQPLQQVGMGYVQLGQPSSTLSGGEAQRIKLATYLSLNNHVQPRLLIFDEPTTGLHLHDIEKLLHAFHRLLQQGHTLVVIEHHLDVIKCADYVIDLGPEGGNEGGYVVFQGPVDQLTEHARSYTAHFLHTKLAGWAAAGSQVNDL